jgi:hypothetical protein
VKPLLPPAASLALAACGGGQGSQSPVTLVSGLFPVAVRDTGASLTFTLTGISGALFSPAIAAWLALHHELGAVGWYIASAGLVSLLALLPMACDPGGHSTAIGQ